jgi:hypothetical protein
MPVGGPETAGRGRQSAAPYDRLPVVSDKGRDLSGFDRESPVRLD